MKRFFPLLRQLLILLGLTLVAAAATKQFHPNAPTWKLAAGEDFDPYQIAFTQLQSQYGMDVLWIDARKPEAFLEGHVPNALNLSQEQWEDQLFTHLDAISTAGKPIIVYCDGSGCALSKKVAHELRELGIADVYFIKGGWEELKAELNL